MTGLLYDLQEECHSAMLHENMNISRLMVHAQHVEEAGDKMKSKEDKKARSFDGGSSKRRVEIQDKRSLKKRVSYQVPSMFPKARDDRVANPKPNKGKGTSSPTKKPTCGNCGKKHYGDCLTGTYNCFGCGKSWHKFRDFPNVRGQDKGSCQHQASGTNESPKKSLFYALCSRGEQETSPDMVTNMLKVFSIDVNTLLDPDAALLFVTTRDVYALLNPGATLSFVTPLVAKRFDICLYFA